MERLLSWAYVYGVGILIFTLFTWMSCLPQNHKKKTQRLCGLSWRLWVFGGLIGFMIIHLVWTYSVYHSLQG